MLVVGLVSRINYLQGMVLTNAFIIINVIISFITIAILNRVTQLPESSLEFGGTCDDSSSSGSTCADMLPSTLLVFAVIMTNTSFSLQLFLFLQYCLMSFDVHPPKLAARSCQVILDYTPACRCHFRLLLWNCY